MLITPNADPNSDPNKTTWCKTYRKECNDLCKRVLQPFMIERPELSPEPPEDENSDFDILQMNNETFYYSAFLSPITPWIEIVKDDKNKEYLRINYKNLIDAIFYEKQKPYKFWLLPQSMYDLDHLQRLQITILYILEFSRENLGKIKSNSEYNRYLENMLAPYWAMVGKVVFMEQKKRYSYLEENWNILKEFVTNDIGKEPNVDHIKASLQSFSTRYQITRIDTAYHVMFTYWGTNPIYNRAFLINEKYRRAMVTNGGIFCYQKRKEGCQCIEEQNIDLSVGAQIDCFYTYDFNDLRDKDDLHEGSAFIAFADTLKNLVSIINNPDDLVTIPKPFNNSQKEETIKVPILTTLSFWGGCGMKIPLNAGITVGFEKVFPAVYVKTKKGSDSIIVQEYAWQTTMVIQDPSIVNINGENFNEIVVETNKFQNDFKEKCKDPYIKKEPKSAENEQENKPLSKDESDHPTSIMTKALGASTAFKGSHHHSSLFEISSQKFNQLIDPDFLKENELPEKEKKQLLKYFRKLDIRVLRTLSECEIVVQLPYVTPQSDSLTSVSFGLLKNGSPGEDEYEAEEEIVLSCS